MPDRYEITRFGMGFEDRHPLKKDEVLPKLRERLNNLKEPLYVQGDLEAKRFNVDGLMTYVRTHLDGLKPGDKIVVFGDAYDQPKWAVRVVEVEPKAPMAHWLEQFVGKSSYGGIGSEGPPGPSDCSAATRNAARAVHHVELDHGAQLQKQDPRIRTFFDRSDVIPDDFIFYNYGRLWWPNADHVELIAHPGPLGEMRTIGSRPSTGGVSFYTVAEWDRDNILCFGRLRT